MAELRVGIGHDTHRLADGGPLKIGGVSIPHDHHAVGHSDADALLHAITDALLGASGLGDIGDMFPDDEPANRGRDSANILHEAYRRVMAESWTIVNLDCIIHAQRPKIGPHKDEIRHRLAQILDIEVERIGVKAKTGERVGPIGHEESIETQCVVLLENANLTY